MVEKVEKEPHTRCDAAKEHPVVVALPAKVTNT